MYSYHNSAELYKRACQSIPGGVNSPVRAFKSVGAIPVFIKSAQGAYLFDEDDNRYIDFIASWGPMILGHACEPVVEAVSNQLKHSFSYGAPTQLEVQMAELVKSMAPNIDLVRMVSSGTEACMSALRLARGYTGRNKVIKFEGCYHGHADSFLVKAGSGIATLDIQTIPGITAGVSNDTLTCAYNDPGAVQELVSKHKNEIAAIIIEPVAGNMGCILPQEGFLETLRQICNGENIVLIFDEVMTGFRLAPGGAQERLHIDADLVTYGKVIGGGFPVAAFGGKKHIMEMIAPTGSIYQAGTLSGNPVAITAGLTTLSLLQAHPEIYTSLEKKTHDLKEGLQQVFSRCNMPVAINQCGSMISVHFAAHAVTNFDTAAACNIGLFKKFFHAMLKRGVYLPPSAFESWFLNTALTEEDIYYTIDAAEKSMEEIVN